MADVHSLTLLCAQPERSPALGLYLQELVPHARAESGCLEYHVLQGSEDSDLWVIQSRWASMADLDTHFNRPYLQAFLDELPKLADEVELYPLISRSA